MQKHISCCEYVLVVVVLDISEFGRIKHRCFKLHVHFYYIPLSYLRRLKPLPVRDEPRVFQPKLPHHHVFNTSRETRLDTEAV